MRIAVLVKQVPDSWGEKKFDSAGRLDRAGLDAVLNDLDEYAVEAALQVQAEVGGDTTAICMGPQTAADAIRRALSMGIDQAVHVCDDSLAGADMQLTTAVLASTIKRGNFDLVIAGVESTDARGGVVPAMLTETLGWPALTYVNGLRADATGVFASRHTKSHLLEISAKLPAIVSVVELANTPRYPNLKGIMAAKSKPVEVLSAADLGVAVKSLTAVVSHVTKPARTRGTVIDASEPNAIENLLQFLRERKAI